MNVLFPQREPSTMSQGAALFSCGIMGKWCNPSWNTSTRCFLFVFFFFLIPTFTQHPLGVLIARSPVWRITGTEYFFLHLSEKPETSAVVCCLAPRTSGPALHGGLSPDSSWLRHRDGAGVATSDRVLLR